MIVAGGLLGLYVTSLYTEHQTLAVGYSLMTVLLIIVGMFTTFVGIILHSLRTLFDDLRER